MTFLVFSASKSETSLASTAEGDAAGEAATISKWVLFSDPDEFMDDDGEDEGRRAGLFPRPESLES